MSNDLHWYGCHVGFVTKSFLFHFVFIFFFFSFIKHYFVRILPIAQSMAKQKYVSSSHNWIGWWKIKIKIENCVGSATARNLLHFFGFLFFFFSMCLRWIVALKIKFYTQSGLSSCFIWFGKPMAKYTFLVVCASFFFFFSILSCKNRIQ